MPPEAGVSESTFPDFRTVIGDRDDSRAPLSLPRMPEIPDDVSDGWAEPDDRFTGFAAGGHRAGVSTAHASRATDTVADLLKLVAGILVFGAAAYVAYGLLIGSV
jgi:hypothetical protein